MAVLINGLAMPTNCYTCPLANFISNGEPYCRITMKICNLGFKRPDSCPLVEVEGGDDE